MKAKTSGFGTGESLWHVDVVLRAIEAFGTDGATLVVRRLSDALQSGADEGTLILPTSSYDAAPPEGSVGASVPVWADDVGKAA